MIRPKSSFLSVISSADIDGSVVVKEVLGGKGNFGYNVATGEFEDLVKTSVVDPTKVTPRRHPGAGRNWTG